MTLPLLIARAAGQTAAVIRGIEHADPTAPTPCVEWDFGQLAAHLTGFLPYSAAAARKQAPGESAATPGAGDAGWADSFEALAADLGSAWQIDGALDGEVQFGPGMLPAEYAAGITLMELAIHGWDLAAAAGATSTYHVDDEIAQTLESLVAGAAANAPAGFFGAPITISDDRGPFERALAASGRDPHAWA